MREIDKVVIHCLDNPDHISAGFVKCNGWHKDRGFKVIVHGKTIYCGYHAIIRKDGTIELGRPISVWGAHCSGQNSKSIGIALEGRKEFTKEQFASLKVLVEDIRECFGKHILFFPHNYFNNKKTCPNFDIYEVVPK